MSTTTEEEQQGRDDDANNNIPPPSMETASSASAAAAGNNSDSLLYLDLPDPDEDSFYPDLVDPTTTTVAAAVAASAANNNNDNNDPTNFVKPTKKDDGGYNYHDNNNNMVDVPTYILGTLVVRVVAARDLEPVHRNGGGLGQLMFGGSSILSSNNNNSRRGSGGGRGGSGSGTANPYASVKFGNSTQRTSEIFDSLDPTWPRNEAMFMDVSLPIDKLTHPTTITTIGGSGSNSNSSTANNQQQQHVEGGGEAVASAASATATVATAVDTTMTKRKYNRKSNNNNSSSGGGGGDGYCGGPTILTVALFHTPEVGINKLYNPSKKGVSGDSDDQFLGMASIDLTRIFTGRDKIFDQWLPLTGGATSSSSSAKADSGSSSSSVRIVCEYEASDPPPSPGDMCQFTTYCNPKDLFPLQPGRKYEVIERNGDIIGLAYKTMEGWDCTFQAHRFMLIVCEERNQNVVETAQDELASVAERFVHSPLLKSVTETTERVAVDGLLNVGEEIVHGGLSLFNRWFAGGIEQVVEDVADVTNWDGRYNPEDSNQLDLPDLISATEDSYGGEGEATTTATKPAADNNSLNNNNIIDGMSSEFGDNATQKQRYGDKPVPLPNMPACPITGEPMVDPVVAADGHTYERNAIARWLTTSDKSPLTGAILSHKELVPNYGLLSSVEAASRTTTAAATSTTSTTTGGGATIAAAAADASTDSTAASPVASLPINNSEPDHENEHEDDVAPAVD